MDFIVFADGFILDRPDSPLSSSMGDLVKKAKLSFSSNFGISSLVLKFGVLSAFSLGPSR